MLSHDFQYVFLTCLEDLRQEQHVNFEISSVFRTIPRHDNDARWLYVESYSKGARPFVKVALLASRSVHRLLSVSDRFDPVLVPYSGAELSLLH